MKESTAMNKPTGYEDDLGSYGPQLYDSWSGEPVSWGFQIIRHLGEERFQELRTHGNLVCNHAWPNPSWYLITEELTLIQAIEKYGDIVHVKIGPRGGFQNVTFGDKTFCSPELNPFEVIDFKTDPRVERDPPSPAMVAVQKRNARKRAAKARAKQKKLAKNGASSE